MKPVSVTQVNEYLANKIDSDFNLRNVAIEGEISGLTRKGHAYFSLKDEQCVIRSVVWKVSFQRSIRNFWKTDATWLRWDPFGCMQKGGTYSFQIHYMEDAGVGKAKTAFEALKKKLEAEGLFRPEYSGIPGMRGGRHLHGGRCPSGYTENYFKEKQLREPFDFSDLCARRECAGQHLSGNSFGKSGERIGKAPY